MLMSAQAGYPPPADPASNPETAAPASPLGTPVDRVRPAKGHGAHSRAGTARGGLLGDSRGLTALAAAIVVLLAGALGALIDLSVGMSLGAVFGVLFTLACAFVAARVHREDLAATIVLPPLAYLALSIVTAIIEPPEGGSLGGGVKDTAANVVQAMILGAPALLAATVAATLIAVVRGRRFIRRR
jgi:hypothetical protein